MASPDYLQLDQRIEGAAVVVRAVGEVDMGSAPALSRQLFLAAATATPPNPVILDLRGAELFGSKGLATLVTAHQLCRQQGTPLRIVAGPSVTRRLRLVGLLQVLSVSAAVDDVTTGPADYVTGGT